MKFVELFKDSYIQLFDDRKYWKEKPPLPDYPKVFPMAELAANVSKYRELNKLGVGVFFTPNPCSGGRKEADVTEIRWVFVDMDSGSKAEQLDRINDSPILPTLVIESQRSYHCYWRCRMNKEQFSLLTSGLIIYFNGDPALTSTNEVLRFPSFEHNKYRQSPFVIKVVKYEEREFEYEDMIEAYPEPVSKWQRQYSLCDDDLPVVKQIPIKQVLDRFGVQYSKKNELIENGEITSAIINDKENYINRFSGKPPSGSVIDVVMYFNNMDVGESIKWLKEAFLGQSPKKPLLGVELKVKDVYLKRYTWGTPQLNHKFAILKREKLTVVYGTRGQGKTTYIFDMAMKNANLGHKVLFFSLEMEREPLINKMCNDYSGISIAEEYDYIIPDFKNEKAKRKREQVDGCKNLIFTGMRQSDDKSWENIVNKILTYGELDLVIIDNLDLISAVRGEANNDKQNRIVKDMATFISKYKLPIILLHHQRKYSTNGKSAGMDDMSGSGKVADTADYVIKVVRDTSPELVAPQKYETVLFLEKAREYTESMHSIYFDRGTFVDDMSQKVLSEKDVKTIFWQDKI